MKEELRKRLLEELGEDYAEEIDYMLDKLCETVEKLRQMSPLYEAVKGDK